MTGQGDRVYQYGTSIADGTPDTVLHDCCLLGSSSTTTLSMAHFLLWLSSLFLLFHFVSSHIIEIPASKKECFFEDLHVNDQVRPRCPFQFRPVRSPIVPDDRHVPGWRRWPPGRRFLGKIGSPLVYPSGFTQVAAIQSRGQSTQEEHKVLHRDSVHHRGEGWAVRVLFLQPNEHHRG
jgi:hypothetical protein